MGCIQQLTSTFSVLHSVGKLTQSSLYSDIFRASIYVAATSALTRSSVHTPNDDKVELLITIPAKQNQNRLSFTTKLFKIPF